MLPNQADPPALSILPHFHLDPLPSVREDSGVALVMPRALSPILTVVHTASRFDRRSPPNLTVKNAQQAIVAAFGSSGICDSKGRNS